MVHRILVGGYTDSVSVLVFDPTTTPPTLKVESQTKVGQNPSWVGRHPTRNDLAAATLEGDPGNLALLKINSESDGAVKVLQRVSTQGADPCHIEWLQDEVIVSNYSGSNVFFAPFTSNTSSPLDETASKHISFEGTGPCVARQEKSHPHQAYLHPTREELLIPDLGADKIWRLLKEGGVWTVRGSVEFEKGHGPRHLLVHEDILYTVGELTATLHAHNLPPLPAPATLIKYIDTLESPLPSGNLDWLPAEVLISTPSSISPPLIYVSNRNEPHPEGDAIAIYTPSSQTSETPFAKVGMFRTGLDSTRGMMFSADGKYLVIGGGTKGGVKVFERLKDALIPKQVAALEGEGVEKPTSFVWLL